MAINSSAGQPSLLTGLRQGLRARRADRVRLRNLERQLAGYETPTDVNDLLLLISREYTSEAEDIRAVLDSKLANWARHAA